MVIKIVWCQGIDLASQCRFSYSERCGSCGSTGNLERYCRTHTHTFPPLLRYPCIIKEAKVSKNLCWLL